MDVGSAYYHVELLVKSSVMINPSLYAQQFFYWRSVSSYTWLVIFGAFFISVNALCLKIAQNVAFEFRQFQPIFCLVALFERKLKVFKNSPKRNVE